MSNLPNTETSSHWPQYLATASATLLSLSSGLHFGWITPALPKLLANELQFPVSKEQASNLFLMIPVGYLIGCSMTAVVLDRIGRKSAMLILAVPQILAWLLIANSTGVLMLYMARITSAISEGGVFTSVPIYICEIVEPKIRGALAMGFTIAFTAGAFLIACYGSYLSIRVSAYLSILVPLVFVATFFWMPPSPYYCIMKGHIEEARVCLRKLRKMQDVEEELTQLISHVERQTSEPHSLRDVFRIRSNLKAFLILLGLRTFQQFSGGASIQFYSQIIFMEAQGSVSYIKSSIVFNAALVIVSSCSSILVDHTGRKPLLIISLVGSALCLFTEGLYFVLLLHHRDVSGIKWLPLTAMIFYTILRGVGVLTIPSLMAGEVLSAGVKAKASGLINIYFGLCISISAKMFQWLSDKFEIYVPFFCFFVFCFLGVLFVHFFVPETKGKSLEEIQQLLKGNTSEQSE